MADPKKDTKAQDDVKAPGAPAGPVSGEGQTTLDAGAPAMATTTTTTEPVAPAATGGLLKVKMTHGSYHAERVYECGETLLVAEKEAERLIKLKVAERVYT